MNREYHPGDVIAIHWIRQTHNSVIGQAAPELFALTAVLTGGSDVDPAEPVRTTGAAVSSPISLIRLPKDAAPGLYELTTTVTSGDGSSVSGVGGIRIAGR